MGRLLALILGGIGIVLYGPELIPGDVGTEVRNVVMSVLGDWYTTVKDNGAGLLAGLALILFAVRGRE
ncbi:MAG: hypothetical protein H6806_11190 [Planctomycetes bacterium]|nr:hypothetical protein [Planctomycetota bacterium]MCB9824904.1 hypothetical protein [Planctomycetota bacterium]MCB9830309.1 hypothetical protein [Planctomycetota bacterium]MCB9902173.1 hypothetical protein [Planctomycetota bacterium]